MSTYVTCSFINFNHRARLCGYHKHRVGMPCIIPPHRGPNCYHTLSSIAKRHALCPVTYTVHSVMDGDNTRGNMVTRPEFLCSALCALSLATSLYFILCEASLNNTCSLVYVSLNAPGCVRETTKLVGYLSVSSEFKGRSRHSF